MKTARLSIILPIYNVEKYIRACVESILVQEHSELVEILLIDDGSTDKSGDICDEYAKKYDNILVYHKKNGGLSDARNYGLSLACGNYVFFLDSDDCIEEFTLEEVFKVIENSDPDVIMGDARYINESGQYIEIPHFSYSHRGVKENEKYTGEEFIKEQLLNTDTYQTTVWLGVYKRQFLIENNLWFEKKLLHEDELWTPKVLLAAKEVRYMNRKFYDYRIRENSIMRNSEDRIQVHAEAFIYIFETMYSYFDWKVKDKKLLSLLKDNLSKRYLHDIVAWKMWKVPNEIKKINRLRIFKNSITKKNKVRALVFLVNKNMFFGIMRVLTK